MYYFSTPIPLLALVCKLLMQIYNSYLYSFQLAAHLLQSGMSKGMRSVHLLLQSPLFSSFSFLFFTRMPRRHWPPGGSGFTR